MPAETAQAITTTIEKQFIFETKKITDQAQPWLFYKHLCNLFIYQLVESSTNVHSQTVKARELKILEKVYFPLCVTHVRCQMSGVTSHESHVLCHYFFFFLGQIVGASHWRVCYQRGLPSLVKLVTLRYDLKNLFVSLLLQLQ